MRESSQSQVRIRQTIAPETPQISLPVMSALLAGYSDRTGRISNSIRGKRGQGAVAYSKCLYSRRCTLVPDK